MPALDNVIFLATSSGTVDFVQSSAFQGYQTLQQAGAVNGTTYKYKAQSSDLSQWEVGSGTYSTTGPTIARVTVLYNSSGSGTLQGGAGTKISFTNPPQVMITITRLDLVSAQRSITSSGSLPIQLNDSVLNINASTDLTPTVPAYGTRLGVPLTFNNKGTHLQTLTATSPDTFDGATTYVLNTASSVTLIPYNDAVNSGYAIVSSYPSPSPFTGVTIGSGVTIGNDFKVFTPQQFGAFGNGGSHQITSTDITNNPQWIGPFNQSPLTTYPVGTEWDVVGIQEWIYACVAQGSTPGNVVWNANNNSGNRKLFCPAGSYQLNRQIWFAAEGFELECEDRLSTEWNWNGYATFTCNSHTTTTLDGISSAAIAQLYVGMYVFDATPNRGLSSIHDNTYITAISSSSITISNATTSTVTGLTVQPQSSMFSCDSVAYGTFRKLTLSANAFIDRADGNFGGGDPASPNNALWVVDNSGTVTMLSPQQLTFDQCIVFGGHLVDHGVAFIPSGGSAQGDTIVFLNCFFSNCDWSAVSITGNNALSIQFINGDVQNCFRYGIYCSSGSFYLDGTSFQGEQNFLESSPQRGQIPWGTFDCYLGSGAGATSTGHLSNVRSEASCGVFTTNGASTHNYALSGADCFDWFSAFPYQLLTCINPSTNNNDARVFCCVDAGGPNTWFYTDPSSSGDTIVVAGVFAGAAGSPGWTVNQWVGYSLFFRFASNGFTNWYTAGITSNTANSITLSGQGLGSSVSAPGTLVFISGNTSTAAPSFDGGAAGNFFLQGGGSQGWSTTAGSTTISFSSGINTPNVGDYIVICADTDFLGLYNGSSRQLRIPLVAKVVSVGSGTLVASRAAQFTANFVSGFSGTAVSDNGAGSVGGYKWLEMPYLAFYGLNGMDKDLSGSGIVQDCGAIRNLDSSRRDRLYGTLGASNYLNQGDVQDGSLTLQTGPTVKQMVAIGTSGTISLQSAFGSGDVFFSNGPTGAMTLNAPAPSQYLSQEITIIILTSGTTSFNITFSSNFKSSGVLATGTASGKYWTVKFVTDGNAWIEVSRTGPL